MSKICKQYSDLTLNQKIALKGYIRTEPCLHIYNTIWLLWGFKEAVNAFLSPSTNRVVNHLSNLIYKSLP